MVLLTIHHGLCILKQLRDCFEQWDADNAKEPKLQRQRAKHGMSGAQTKLAGWQKGFVHVKNALSDLSFTPTVMKTGAF